MTTTRTAPRNPYLVRSTYFNGGTDQVRTAGDMAIRTGVKKGLRDAHHYARQAQLRGGTAQVVKTSANGAETIVATYPRPMHLGHEGLRCHTCLGPKAHRQAPCAPHPSTLVYIASQKA